MCNELQRVKDTTRTYSLPLLIAVLFTWYLSSTIFNDTTPRLLRALQDIGGQNIDVTVIEFSISIVIGCVSLTLQKQRAFPSSSYVLPCIGIGLLHVVGCRLFLFGLQYIPVSLAQTIRAANPLITVIFSVIVFQAPLPSSTSLLSLVPILAGFGMAIAADLTVEPIGVVASIGSVCCLVLVNGLSKKLLEGKGSRQSTPTGSELQSWTLQGAFLLLSVYWGCTGGPQRFLEIAQTAGRTATRVLTLCAWDGLLYFTEQVSQFLAIGMLTPLSLAVTDTTRRMFIVFVSGFVLQGNTPNARNIVGALLVYVGAALYALSVHQTNAIVRSATVKKDA